MIPLEEARRFVLDRCVPLEPVRTVLGEAHGRVVAEPVAAADAVPPFDNSAMDGFALRSEDVAGASPDGPVELDIVATVPAGASELPTIGPGDAVRIMTGAPIPPGADAVIMVERTSVTDDGATVRVVEPVETGRHVRRSGEDVSPGDIVVEPGVELSPAHLGVLASVGRREVLVTPRARVGVFSTGDELVAPGRPLAPGQIRDSNRVALLATIATEGFEPVDLGRVADDETAVTEAIADAVERCDAIVTSGGVSMGEFDFVKTVLGRMGEMRWMQIAIKPAKPFAFGTVTRGDGRRVAVFGLPGNPVSSLVSFELLARPGLRRISGHPDTDLVRPVVRGVADDDFVRRADGKTHYVRVVTRFDADGRRRARRAGGQGSHQLAPMARADALAVLPDGDGVRPGAAVDLIVHRP